MIGDVSTLLLELGLGDSATDSERALAQLCLQRTVAQVVSALLYDPEYKVHTEYYPQGVFNNIVSDGIMEVTSNQAYMRDVGFGSSELQLKHIPIRSITSLWINYEGRSGSVADAFGAAQLKVHGEDFWVNADVSDSETRDVCLDGILRSQGLWPSTPGSVKVTYWAGYKPEELAGNDAVLDASPILAAIYNDAQIKFLKSKTRAKQGRAGFSGPLSGEVLGDYSYKTIGSGMGGALTNLLGSTYNLSGEALDMIQPFIKMDLGIL